MKKVIIVGAGGHGKVVADIVKCCGDEVVGFLDDKEDAELPGFHIVGKTSYIGSEKDCFYFVAIGNAEIRAQLMNGHSEAQWYTAIHPSAVVAEDVAVGAGSCVMANAVINVGTHIGHGCIINTAATVDHDCKLADYVHICPGAHVAGTVEIGENTLVGIGTSVVNNVSICGKCLIGAGSVVIRDIEEPGTYVGMPVKKV